MRDAGRGQRTDRLSDVDERLQVPQTWTAEAETTPDNPVASASATALTDFDMTLNPQ